MSKSATSLAATNLVYHEELAQDSKAALNFPDTSASSEFQLFYSSNHPCNFTTERIYNGKSQIAEIYIPTAKEITVGGGGHS